MIKALRLQPDAVYGLRVRSRRIASSLSRFVTVGGLGLAVNQGFLWLLVSELKLDYLAGAALATVASTTFNFVGTESWVFRGRRRSDWKGFTRRYVSYACVNCGTLVFRLPLLFVLTSDLRIHYLTANLITLVLLTLVRYAIADGLIWSQKPALRGEMP
jgi:putative flippase GtrA